MTNRPVRILYFTSFFIAQGGASLSFIKLLEAFNNKRFQSYAVLPIDAKSQIEQLQLAPKLERHIIYIALDRISRQLLHPQKLLRFGIRAVTSILQIRQIIRKFQIDIIHSNDLRDFHAPISACMNGIPVAWHLRASRPNPLTRYPVATLIHLFASKIIAVSRCTAEQMLLPQSFAQNKVKVIHNPGPYRDKFHSRLDGRKIRQEFGIPDNAPLITMIGKLSQRKGHTVFVKALPLILAKHPKARFIIVGGELEGHDSYARSLYAMSKRFVQDKQLIFAGERSDVPEMIAASDIIVQCSLCQDAFPGVVLEAMAIGKAVIACSAGGTPEQITDGEDGLLFPMGNVTALAYQVHEILTRPDLKKSLELNAVKNLEKKFNFGKFKNELAQLYTSLACSRL